MEHDGLGCGVWRRIAAGDTLGTMDTHTTAPVGITLAGVGRIDTDARHAMAVFQLSTCVMAELAKRSKVFDALAAGVFIRDMVHLLRFRLAENA